VSIIRVTYRLLGFVIFTLVWIIAFYVQWIFLKDTLAAGVRWRSVWLRVMPRFLGLRVSISGYEHLPDTPSIFVGNHRSYIDPVIAAKFARAVIVAKSEIAGWPLIGIAAQMSGVLFVKREDKKSRSTTLRAMEMLLKRETSILVFPEGTTTRAPGFQPFRPGSFLLASDLGIPVVPFAIEYEDPDDAWVDDDTFVRHLLQIFEKKHIDVHVTIGKAVTDTDGIRLMNTVHQWIAAELQSMSPCISEKS